MSEGNVLYYGDNLDVLRRHVRDESVDLVYLDPPFNSNADYNVLFSEHGEKSAAQVRAFEDTWVWDTNARLAYEETVEMGGRVADAMRAFRTMLGGSDMLAYLSMMAPRLIELRRVLKPTGSMYLHCDPTASHYLKVLLDSIFLPTNFRGEVHWKRTSSHNDSRRWPQIHDTLLFYAQPGFTWNPVFLEHDPEYLTKFYRHHDARGRYRLHEIIRTGSMGPRPNLTYEYKGYTPQWGWRTVREKLEALDGEDRIEWGTSGRPYLKRYLAEQEGTMASSLWTDIPPLSFAAAEKLGFPTQKPLALLERIVKASSNPGDLVLDPFCGCGTTIDAAQALDRRWIGIDITHLSIGLIKHRLTRYGPEIASTYRVVGEPTAVEDAAELARQDPFQFQAWALGLVGARIAGSDKKGGDKGIDGRLYFHEGTNSPTRQIILSVKAGNIVPTYVDALWGVVEREKAEIGVLLSFQEPSPGMRARAAEAGFYESPWGKHPRLQLRTIRDLLAGKGIDYPHVTGANVTLKRAQRVRPAEAEAMEMFGRAAEEPAEYD